MNAIPKNLSDIRKAQKIIGSCSSELEKAIEERLRRVAKLSGRAFRDPSCWRVVLEHVGPDYVAYELLGSTWGDDSNLYFGGNGDEDEEFNLSLKMPTVLLVAQTDAGIKAWINSVEPQEPVSSTWASFKYPRHGSGALVDRMVNLEEISFTHLKGYEGPQFKSFLMNKVVDLSIRYSPNEA
jgi:hypothetical protein